MPAQLPGALTGQVVHGALDVAGGEIHELAGLHVGVVELGERGVVPLSVHATRLS